MKTRPFVAALLAVALGGCGHIPTPYQTYPGAPRPNSEVAVVMLWHAAFNNKGRAITAFAVDERDLGRLEPLIDLRGYVMSMSPGAHKLGISLRRDLADSRKYTITEYTIDADLKADMLYTMCPTPEGGVHMRTLGSMSAATATVDQWQQTLISACK